MKLAEACDAYLQELQARKREASTFRNYDYFFRAWRSYAEECGLAELNSFDQSEIRRWRDSWTTSASTTRLRLSLLRAFFAYALREGWVDRSPMTNVLNPKVQHNPTLPLNHSEVQTLIRAARGHEQERALLLLMRYSGLAIRDAVTCKQEHIKDSTLTLRRAKSGELVIVHLPKPVTRSLETIGTDDSPYFFWTGSSEPVTATKYWRKRLQTVAKKAGLDDFRPHRLRDTFAVELLVKGVPIQDVSSLLGHSSVKTTERHYAPWNQARRDRLIQITRKANESDPLLKELSEKLQ